MHPLWPKSHYTLLEVVEELCKSEDEQNHSSSDDEPDMLLPEETSDPALDRWVYAYFFLLYNLYQF